MVPTKRLTHFIHGLPPAPACTMWVNPEVWPRKRPIGLLRFRRCRAPLFVGEPVVGLDDALKFRLPSADCHYVTQTELSHMELRPAVLQPSERPVLPHRTRTHSQTH